MELKHYGSIVLRRWWVIVALVILAAISAVAFRPQVQQSYQAGLKLAFTHENEKTSQSFFSSEYYNYLSAEYLLDDLISTIESPAFVADVQAHTKNNPAGSISAKKAHRVLELTITSGTKEDAIGMGETVASLLADPNSRYLTSLTKEKTIVSVIQPATITGVPGESRKMTDLGLRVVLALLAGIGLAFLLDYLDDSIRGIGDIETATGLRVIAEIPKTK
jgi:capsular polysaccharide biosynthesis protein